MVHEEVDRRRGKMTLPCRSGPRVGAERPTGRRAHDRAVEAVAAPPVRRGVVRLVVWAARLVGLLSVVSLVSPLLRRLSAPTLVDITLGSSQRELWPGASRPGYADGSALWHLRDARAISDLVVLYRPGDL
jgi:hypothetical protein